MTPAITLLTVRARRALARPAVRRLLVATLSVVTAIVVVALVGGAQAARDRWGRTRPVVVATRDLAAGAALDGGAVVVRDRPLGVVPAGALRTPPPAGTVVRQPIVAGEPVVGARLAPDGLTGAAALVPAGQRALAVPPGPAGTPPLAVGDRVDVVAVVAGGGGGGDPPALTLAERATVVAAGADAVTVAVPERAAPRVAWALTNGAVVLALAGAGR
jgi:Flp pilus assembly protein CpaB